MSLIYMDGYDYLDLSTIQGHHSAFLGADGWYADTGRTVTEEGRFGIGKCLSLKASGAGLFELYSVRAIPKGRQEGVGKTIVWGMAYYTADVLEGRSIYMALYDSLTERRLIQFNQTGLGSWEVWTNCDGVRGYYTGTRLGRSAINLWKKFTWHYVELKFTMPAAGSATGSVEMKVDGEIIIAVTNVNITAGAVPAPNTVGFDGIVYGVTRDQFPVEFKVDDMYLLDTSGPAPHNNYLGNIRVGSMIPDSIGDRSEMDPVGAATNWGAIVADKNMTLADPTYVTTTTVGDTDLYNLQANIPARAVFGLQLAIFYRQTDAVQLYSSNILKVNGVEYSAPERGVSQTYSSRHNLWDVNPNTGLLWTNTELAALQAGPRLNRSD